MIITNFSPFKGQHCETVATGSLLKHIGIELSEPMLFGLGEGLSFIFLNLKTLPLPFLGGRLKPFELTDNLCRNLNLNCSVNETTSKAKAWKYIEVPLRDNLPVALQLDCYYLEYFSSPVHFAGHFVAVYGLDEENVYIVDTLQQGYKNNPLQVSTRENIESARFEKGPMAAKARTWTITGILDEKNLPSAILQSIRNNAEAYLNPTFQGLTFEGINKLGKSVQKWLEMTENPEKDFELAATLMERAGTGGSLFRNFYRDFLAEAIEQLPKFAPSLERAHKKFTQSASNWRQISELLIETSKTKDKEPLLLASRLAFEISEIEKSAMAILNKM